MLRSATRDAVRLAIHNYFWNDATDLLEETFDKDDVKLRAEVVSVYLPSLSDCAITVFQRAGYGLIAHVAVATRVWSK